MKTWLKAVLKRAFAVPTLTSLTKNVTVPLNEVGKAKPTK